MRIPPLALVRQSLPDPVMSNIQEELSRSLLAFGLDQEVTRGSSVAIVAGSRGIDNISAIVEELVRAVRNAGGVPFITTGMGSHGGATAEGQVNVLHKLGITEENVKAPVCATMDTVLFGHTSAGCPVYCDALAAAADCVILVNRIKPHTSFSGEVESGLMKMAAIGLGNDVGCREIHAFGLGEAIVPAARIVFSKLKSVIGVAVLENNRGKTCEIRVARGGEIEAAEKEMLVKAKHLAPKLPFAEIDLLVIDEIGKNISGTGMDTKVVGRVNRAGVPPEGPGIDKIVVLDLTEKSGGNALGIGIADVTTRRLVEKIDHRAMYENALSTRFLDRAKIPVTMENDREAIVMGLRTLKNTDSESWKIVRIKNTLSLDCFYVSSALLPAVRENPRLHIVTEPEEIQYDQHGNLTEKEFG